MENRHRVVGVEYRSGEVVGQGRIGPPLHLQAGREGAQGAPLQAVAKQEKTKYRQGQVIPGLRVQVMAHRVQRLVVNVLHGSRRCRSVIVLKLRGWRGCGVGVGGHGQCVGFGN